MIGEMLTFATVTAPQLGSAGTLGAAGIIGILGKHLWDKYVSTEGKAHAQLIEHFQAELVDFRSRIATMETRLQSEIGQRIAAEVQIERLKLRVEVLERELTRHNITVPE